MVDSSRLVYVVSYPLGLGHDLAGEVEGIAHVPPFPFSGVALGGAEVNVSAADRGAGRFLIVVHDIESGFPHSVNPGLHFTWNR